MKLRTGAIFHACFPQFPPGIMRRNHYSRNDEKRGHAAPCEESRKVFFEEVFKVTSMLLHLNQIILSSYYQFNSSIMNESRMNEDWNLHLVYFSSPVLFSLCHRKTIEEIPEKPQGRKKEKSHSFQREVNKNRRNGILSFVTDDILFPVAREWLSLFHGTLKIYR